MAELPNAAGPPRRIPPTARLSPPDPTADRPVARFYRDLMGMEITKQNWRAGMVFLSADPKPEARRRTSHAGRGSTKVCRESNHVRSPQRLMTSRTTISTWPVHFLSYLVRDKQLLSLEQAHYKMSTLPAWLANFKERGALRIGDWADIMVYNLVELGYVYDKPAYASDFLAANGVACRSPLAFATSW